MSDEVLERRVAALEQEVEGEKTVSRYILEHTRRNTADIAELKADVKVLKADVAVLKVDVAGLKADVTDLKKDMGLVKSELRDLRSEFPGMIAETMREVLRERDGKV